MPELAVQFAAARLLFCCNVQPVDGDGHDTITWLPERVIVKGGAPGVCTTLMSDQNPPVSE